MVEVTVDRILLNPIAEYRVVILKEIGVERYLPIYIGRPEADAIALRLQGHEHHRPMTHDLLNNVIAELGGEVSHIVVNDMRNDTFYARIYMNVNGQQLDIDSRPSDAIALAVRCDAPIFVEEEVMQTGITPEPDISEGVDGEELEAFRDFVDSLDLDDMPIQ
jgi:bifunctional DNase/RNase